MEKIKEVLDYLIYLISYDTTCYNEIKHIGEFLTKYKEKKIIYIPNPGNAGDSLIAYGTILLFYHLNMEWEIGHHKKTYNNEILFYAGGGNLVGLYSDCKDFLNNNKDKNEIILLPHTIKDEDELLKSLNENIIIFCREHQSYDYVYSHLKHKDNIYLSKDIAFYIEEYEKDNLDVLKKKEGKGVCNCFREDVEKTHITVPDNNIDLSNYYFKPNNTNNIEVIKEVTWSIFEHLSNYETINSNRLHVSIASSFLNKKINIYPNSYYKNKKIFEYSIKNEYKNSVFIE